jgi:hypothetical protein
VGCTYGIRTYDDGFNSVSGTCPRTCPFTAEIDEMLAKVLAAWPDLDAGMKKAIVAIAGASAAD